MKSNFLQLIVAVLATAGITHFVTTRDHDKPEPVVIVECDQCLTREDLVEVLSDLVDNKFVEIYGRDVSVTGKIEVLRRDVEKEFTATEEAIGRLKENDEEISQKLEKTQRAVLSVESHYSDSTR